MNTPDPGAIAGLAGWAPEHGVVSVYLGIDPADRREGWRIELRDGLKRLVEQAHEEGPRERWLALLATTERISQLFPAEGDHPEGRCQIAFAEVAEREGRLESYQTQMPPQQTMILHDAGPFLRPLVELLDDGAPRGIVALSAERVRLFEWKLGEIRELEDWDLSSVHGPPRDKKAPSRDPSTGTGTSSSGRDQYDRAMDEHREKFVKEVGDQAVRQINRRGWPETLCFGDEGLMRAFSDGLGPKADVRHVDEHNIVSEEVKQVGERVEALLDDLNRTREMALVERAKNAVFAEGGRGALGVQDTLDALVEGRVEHLLFDAERDYRGAWIDHQLRYGEVGDEGQDEPRLAERMIEQALQTSASVTPLEGEAAAALSEHEGVAAILRY